MLFYLVGVQDATGNAARGAANVRRLDIHVPESKKGEFARVWVSGAADPGKPPKPVRAEFFSPDSHAALDIEDAQLSVSVPASAFEPDAAQRANLLDVPAERFPAVYDVAGQGGGETAQAVHPGPSHGQSMNRPGYNAAITEASTRRMPRARLSQ